VQETRDKVDEASRAYVREKAGLIQAIGASKNPLEIARERAAEIDDAFFSVLQANAQDAERRGDEQTLRGLEAISNIAMQVLTERQPPEVQLVNALLAANYPDETEKLLNEMKDIADDRMVEVMSQFADQLSQEDRTELAAKLTKIMMQARKILPKYDASADPRAATASNQPSGTPPSSPLSPSSPPPEPPKPPKPIIEIARR